MDFHGIKDAVYMGNIAQTNPSNFGGIPSRSPGLTNHKKENTFHSFKPIKPFKSLTEEQSEGGLGRKEEDRSGDYHNYSKRR